MGRTAELQEIQAALLATRQGADAAILITGEPGIGKTRLLREAADRAAELGFQVMYGGGTELEHEIPYAAVIDALDEPLSALRRADLTALGRDSLAELGRLLPSLAAWAGPLATTLQVERHRCHHAIRSVLHRLAARRPVLLVLDDVQWADHASVEVVVHLLRHRSPGLMLLLAHRRPSLPDIASAALYRAAYDRTLTVLELGALSLGETAELVHGEDLDDGELTQLHDQCGGNPFYLQELARVWRRSAAAAAGDGGTGPLEVPAAIRVALAQEIRALSPDARRLLHAAAVAGGSVEWDLAVEISELTPAQARRATNEVVETGIVHGSATPGRLVFRHPIVRLAVYEAAGYGWRTQAHRRAATALARRGAALAVRAHHWERCATVGDEQAITLLTETGVAVAPRAPVAAARWFRAALRLLSDDAPARQRLSLSLSLADALNATGRLGECSEVLRRALDLIPAEAVTDRAGVLTRIALTEQGLGNATEGGRLLTAALSLTPAGSLTAGALQLELAKNHLMMRDWDEAARVTRQVRSGAQDCADQRLYLAATAADAYMGTLQCGDSLVQASARLDEAASALDALTDTEVAPDLLDGLTNVVYAEVSLERFASAAAHAARGIRLSRDTGHGRHLVELQHLRALAFLMQGRLEAGLSAAASAVESALLLGNSPMVALTEATRCWLLMLLGRIADSLASGALAVRVNAQAPNALFAWHAPLVHGAALIEAGRYRHGRRELLTVAGGHEQPPMFPTTMPYFYRYLVDSELALGRVDAAEQTTRQVESIVGAMPMLSMRAGDAKYCRARIQLHCGDDAAARITAEQSVAAYEAAGTPVEAARARLLLGHALSGYDEAAAEREFDSALSTAEICGAARLAERARLGLHRVGGRRPSRRRDRPPATTDRLGDLTERQTEIVSRVVLGRTNKQISEELHLSEKTVEAHLTRLYTRLGVSSRTELAAVASGSWSTASGGSLPG
ncbi:helix-turn-helix transcriptional regulator [Nocardia sienata]|uniref:helix-turn-helix transcriptional regulator n=1 Tax=Nocardia sienata TaxID=248552 RepID=UPI0007A3AECF|nr:AAA family ATPase [Nocardia sienata]